MANDITSNEDIKRYFPGIYTAKEYPPVRVVPTGLVGLDDIVLGCGGIPRGRTIELYAKSSAGKTTVAINLIVSYLRQGLRAAWDDREGTFPGPEYTDPIGLDRELLTMMDTSTGNDALFQFQLMAALNLMDLYVIDSMGAILPEGASEATMDGLSMNQKLQRASMLTTFFSQIRSGYHIGPGDKVKKDGTWNVGDMIEADKKYIVHGKEDKFLHKLTDKDTTLLIINHMKTKPGQSFGDDSTTPGGDSGKFDASVRLRITHKKKSKKKDKYGSPEFKVIEIRADKNKVAPPFRSAEFFMMRDGRLLDFDKQAVKDSDMETVDDNDEIQEGSRGVRLKR
jgi:recombination protein RecA